MQYLFLAVFLFFPAGLYSQSVYRSLPAYAESFIAHDMLLMIFENGNKNFYFSGGGNDNPEKKFCLGELSAIFTHMAVLRLAEQGRLSLNEDAFAAAGLHQYSRKEKPVTAADLLKHSHNLRHSVFRLRTASPETRIRATAGISGRRLSFTDTPGSINKVPFSASLLALIIEKTTGDTFENHMKHRIFSPIGMDDASYIPPEDAASLPRSLYPADSGLWISRRDLMNFMIFLTSPDPGYKKIFINKHNYFRPETNAGPVPSCGYVFCTKNQGRPIIISEASAPDGYRYFLIIENPQRAVFLRYRSDTEDFTWFLRKLFLPPDAPPSGTYDDRKDIVSAIAGYYLFSNASDNTDFFWYLLKGISIRVNNEYQFLTAEPVTSVPPLLREEAVSFVQVSPLFYRALENRSRILFSQDRQNGTWMFVTSEPDLPAFIKQTDYINPAVILLAAVFFVIYFIRYTFLSMHSYCRSWPVCISGRLISMLHLVFIILFYPVFMKSTFYDGLPAVAGDTTPAMYMLLSIPLLTMALNAWFLFWLPYRYKYDSICLKWFKFLLINLIFYFILYQWNLIGFPR